MTATRDVSCLSCSRPGLVPILDLGRTPLANALLSREQLDQPEPTSPLELAFCPDCTLVQITETTPPEVLFREYVYFSSYSDTMLQHAQSLAERLIESRRLTSRHLVVEIASNDGYLRATLQKSPSNSGKFRRSANSSLAIWPKSCLPSASAPTSFTPTTYSPTFPI